MKIVELCLGGFYSDGYSYHENLLSRYHRQLGYENYIVTSLQTFDKNGRQICVDECPPYINEDGIEVTRLPFRGVKQISKKLKFFKGLYEVLCNKNPDVIYIHNFQFMEIKQVVKYLKKNRHVKVFADSHADFSNSATNWLSKTVLHKFLWRRCAKSIEPYVTKFFGVTPARVDFIIDLYKLPPEKCELLVMGVKDELVEESAKPEVRAAIRKKYGVENDDFLLMFGGKIDLFKKQLLLLMDAINEIENPKIKLIVFGSVVPEMKEAVESKSYGKVKYIGWVESDESYPLFASCDLAVFPGRHSVFWEQVAGQGIPLLVKYWDGTTHVDIGGNAKFLYEDSKEEIKNAVLKIAENKDLYNDMKKVATENGIKEFSYRNIAKRSVEAV